MGHEEEARHFGLRRCEIITELDRNSGGEEKEVGTGCQRGDHASQDEVYAVTWMKKKVTDE